MLQIIGLLRQAERRPTTNGQKIASRPLSVSPDPRRRGLEITAVMMVFAARILLEDGVIGAFRRSRRQADVEGDGPDRGADSGWAH